jgi:hypothetical protein
MELLAAPPNDGHEVRLLQHRQVLGHRLPGHVQTGAELPQRLAVIRAQSVQQLSPTAVGQRLEDLFLIGIHGIIMQPFGCMSSPFHTNFRNVKNNICMEFVIVPKGKACLGRDKDKLGDKAVEIPARELSVPSPLPGLERQSRSDFHIFQGISLTQAQQPVKSFSTFPIWWETKALSGRVA